MSLEQLKERKIKISKEIVWEIIKQLNHDHPAYPVVVTMLAKFATELEKGK